MDSTTPRGLSLPIRIAIGLVAGAVLGIAARGILPPDTLKAISANVARPIGAVFLNLMFMVVIPLIFSSLALGVAGLGNLRSVGRLGARILAGTVLLTATGVFLGIALVSLVQPGRGLSEATRAELIASHTKSAEVEKRLDQARQSKDWAQVVIDAFTRNPFEDIANLFNPNPNYKGGGIISLLVFTILVGAAITTLPESRARPFTEFLESLQAISMKIIGFAMAIAPFGVAALIFQTSASLGLELFGVLGKYITCVLVGLAIHLLLTYSIVLRAFSRVRPLAFFKAIEEAIITAFSTSSSNATLPTTIRVAHENLRLDRATSSFVLTVGSTGNQNGTALFEGVTVLFLAQFYGIDLSLNAQVTVVLMSIVAGIGTAGVPGGSIPLIALLLTQVGIPAEGIGIILGVDRLLDMSRTTVNVAGDLVLATVVDPIGATSTHD